MDLKKDRNKAGMETIKQEDYPIHMYLLCICNTHAPDEAHTLLKKALSEPNVDDGVLDVHTNVDIYLTI